MRVRKRNWPIVVYRFDVRLEAPLPDVARQEAGLMQALWNQLVDAFERRQAASQAMLARVPGMAKLQARVAEAEAAARQADTALKAARQRLRRRTHPELVPLEMARQEARTALQEARKALAAARREAREHIRPALRELQDAFLAEARKITETCPLTTWSHQEFILNHFLQAVARFRRGQAGPPKRKSGELRELHFHHRFTGGGVPVEALFGRGQRVHLDPVPAEAFDPTRPQRQRKRLARTTGHFRVGAADIPFRLILHRPFPEGAVLKAAALVGRQIVGEGYHLHRDGGHRVSARWAWSLHLTLEVPPMPTPVRDPHEPVAGLDLNYRVWGDGRLRIGVLVNSEGQTEELFLPRAVLSAFEHKRKLQAEADALLEETKAVLQDTRWPEPLPQEARAILTRLKTLRSGGLLRLLRVLEAARMSGPPMEALRRWFSRSTRLLREARGLERRYLAHRDWDYRNLALRLCRRYRTLVVEALDLKQMASKQDGHQTYRLDEAAKYRHLVALSRLLAFLKAAATRTGTQIQQHDPAYTTLDCATCGARVPENPGTLYLTCPGGHQFDQDLNAALNLLATLGSAFAKTSSRAPDNEARERPQIPDRSGKTARLHDQVQEGHT